MDFSGVLTDFSGVLKDDGFHSRSATCCGLLCEWQWRAFTSVDPKIQDTPKTDGETILHVQHVFVRNGSFATFSIRFINSTDHTFIRPWLTTLSKWWRLNGCFDTNYLHKPGNKKHASRVACGKLPRSVKHRVLAFCASTMSMIKLKCKENRMKTSRLGPVKRNEKGENVSASYLLVLDMQGCGTIHFGLP